MTPKASPSQNRITVHDAITQVNLKDQLEQDVRAGFDLTPKELPPTYFYDADGSNIFELITELPEYYVTRSETDAIRRLLAEEALPYSRLSEIGSGSSLKTRLLLESMHAASPSGQIVYQPVDISRSAILEAAQSLTKDYAWLKVEGIVGDLFNDDLTKLRSQTDPQLMIFLGNTLGNLTPDQRSTFLKKVAQNLGPDDKFLLGLDLKKSPEIIYAAYNDAQGVTARFNKNVIRVLKQQLGATIEVEDFEHDAPYVESSGRVEMRLYAQSDLIIAFKKSDLPTYDMKQGDYIRTEISCKFTREMVREELDAADIKLVDWCTDERGYVGLAVARL